jgi:TetR/AcrR family transcriptional repressor of lmrAB and yxaGH operons
MSDTRKRMVEIGAQLMRKKGYLTTSLVEIVEVGGLPRGSIYHHFPDGKPQLAIEAIKYASAEVGRDMLDVAARASSPQQAIEVYLRLLADRLERTDFEDGCWYATTAMEVVGTEPALAEALDKEFQRWQGALMQAFRAWGVAGDRAGPCAALVIAAVEGGMLRARLARNTEHLLCLAPLLQDIVTAAGGAAARGAAPALTEPSER